MNALVLALALALTLALAIPERIRIPFAIFGCFIRVIRVFRGSPDPPLVLALALALTLALTLALAIPERIRIPAIFGFSFVSFAVVALHLFSAPPSLLGGPLLNLFHHARENKIDRRGLDSFRRGAISGCQGLDRFGPGEAGGGLGGDFSRVGGRTVENLEVPAGGSVAPW